MHALKIPPLVLWDISLMTRHAAVIVPKILGVKSMRYLTKKTVLAYVSGHAPQDLLWIPTNASVYAPKHVQKDTKGQPTATVSV